MVTTARPTDTHLSRKPGGAIIPWAAAANTGARTGLKIRTQRQQPFAFLRPTRGALSSRGAGGAVVELPPQSTHGGKRVDPPSPGLCAGAGTPSLAELSAPACLSLAGDVPHLDGGSAFTLGQGVLRSAKPGGVASLVRIRRGGLLPALLAFCPAPSNLRGEWYHVRFMVPARYHR